MIFTRLTFMHIFRDLTSYLFLFVLFHIELDISVKFKVVLGFVMAIRKYFILNPTTELSWVELCKNTLCKESCIC